MMMMMTNDNGGDDVLIVRSARCENVHSNTTQCELWALQGECSKNPGYMIAQCTRTCLGCGLKDPGTSVPAICE